MNYYKARELMDENGKGTGLWHYTCMNDNKVWPIGNCSAWESCKDCSSSDLPFKLGGPPCSTCDGKRIVRKTTPCPGHKTAEEAEAHYKEYVMAGVKILGPKQQEWPKNKCHVKSCNKEATHLANVGPCECYELCEEHATKEIVETMVVIGESWSSY